MRQVHRRIHGVDASISDEQLAESRPAACQVPSPTRAGAAGETMVAGQAMGTNAAGRGVHKNETATGSNYGEFVMGECLKGGAAGELGEVLLSGPYRE